MRRLTIPEALLATIRGEAEAGYPHEACGFLIGRLGDEGTGEIQAVLAAVNTRSGEDRRRRYLIEPDTYLQAERNADANDRDIVGFWHSHPDAPARPSSYDLEHAWPVLAYVIVAIAGGRASEVAAWRLAEDRSGFAAVDLEIRTES